MNRIVIFFAFFILCTSVSAQIPKGINYQAVALDASGFPIKKAAIKVKFGILSDTTKPADLWEELHDPVYTNSMGVFSLVVGQGIRQSGAVPSFDSIDWNKKPLFLRTSLFINNSWIQFGNAKLWSVPYAMVSADLEGPVSRLEVIGNDLNSDDALFEIKRKDGNTVFAVFNHGVRIYLPADTLTKAKKSGFAIGSFDKNKGITQDYFTVSADSIRGYINTGNGKGLKGGFAIGGFDNSKSLTGQYLHISDSSTRINIATDRKGIKGGFAIGSFDNSKGEPVPFVDLTPENYFIGHETGINNTTGLYNSVIGYRAGRSNTSGNSNIFIGYESGFSNTLGRENTFVGYQAGYSNIGNNYPGVFQHGRYNCFFGYMAGYSSQMGDNNTMLGYMAGYNNQANFNTFIGSDAGYSTTHGGYNTFIGKSAGYYNLTGGGNVFMGHMAGYNNSEGEDNIYIGTSAGAIIKTGSGNVIIGKEAGSGVVYGMTGTGSENVFIGNGAGKYCENGNANVFIGSHAGANETGSNLLVVDNSSTSTPLIYGNFQSNFFRVNGNIEATGTIVSISDSSLKKDIETLDNTIEKIKKMRGVSFTWNKRTGSGLLLSEKRQIGLIAQEVEMSFPELIAINDKGYKMVDYQRFSAVLLEALKDQQQQIEKQQKEIDKLKTLIEDLMKNYTSPVFR